MSPIVNQGTASNSNSNTVRSRFFFWDWRVPLLVVICSVLFFQSPDNAPFYNKQEAREALVVWEIIHSGNWILPLRNGVEIPSKPPLYHWLAALTAKSMNQLDEFTVRFPSAFLGTLGVLLTYLAGAILWGRSAGLVAALILSTSFEWRQAAKVARVDMTLTFVLLCAFLFFLYLYRTGGGTKKAIILGLILGLATLAKGPLGFVVPGFTYLLFLWVRRDLSFVRRLHPFLLISTCAVVAGSWYALALWQGGKSFLEVVIKENFSMTIGQEAGHPHPFFSYILFFFQNMAPWSLFVIPLAVSLYRSRRQLAQEQLLYFVVWSGVVFIFFSAFTQKRPVYILSLYPAVALLLGAWWQKLKDSRSVSSHILTRATAYLNAASFLLLSGVLLFQILGEGLAPYIRPVLYPTDQAQFLVLSNLLLEQRPAVFFWATVCGLGGVFLIVTARKEAWGPFVGCMTALMVISLFFVQKFDVYFANHYSFKPFVKRVLPTINDAPLYFYLSDDYGVIFYTGRRVPKLDTESLPRDNSPYYLFVWEKQWEQFTNEDGLSLVAASENPDPLGKGRLFLVSVSKPEEKSKVTEHRDYAEPGGSGPGSMKD
jgi:4-amino-4-deoxy-L-arabinose transferase-like glycosyltransferase